MPADRRAAMRTRAYLDELDDPDEDDLLALDGVFEDQVDLTMRTELGTRPFDD